MNQENNKREATTFDVQAVNSASSAFFKRWWKLLLIVFVVAAIASAVASMFIKPLYMSTGVMMPTNSNRLTKAIMDYHYSMDFMDYGAEDDCEHAVQILMSKQMETAVCDHFNLMEHYAIKPTDKYKKTDLSKRYKRYVTVKRTDYLGVQVSVLDQDPQMAADIVNYMLDMYDTICHDMHHERAVDAAEVMNAVCNAAMEEMDSLASTAKGSAWKDYLLRKKSKKLAEMQARAVQTSVDKDMTVSYRYVVDRGEPSDKKDRPKRALIVLGGSLGALLVCIFGLLVFAPAKKEEE
ncbi:MAG: hypothetical protein K6F72_01505 [Bacteroidales bacterium]|nr:hypothetical protein [Bacteroidales bacterium]